jgi:AcrR family transcriptional regulator
MSSPRVKQSAAIGPSVEDGSLPVGSDRPSRERVERMQRERIMQAMLEVASERRYQGSTIEAVLAGAGVSRTTFSRLFGDLQTCFVEMLGVVEARSMALVIEAFEGESSWPEGVLAGLAALLAFLDSAPSIARVCLLEAFAVGPHGVECRTRELAVLRPLVEAGRAYAPADRQPSALIAEAAVGSVEWLLRTRLVRGEAPPFIGLLGAAGELVLTPYLDTSALADALGRVEEFERDASQRRQAEPSPWRAADIPRALRNPTARRARAIMRYIADHPGTSNRQVQAEVGISHIGQTSQTLARLEREGLLDKRAGRVGRPNAWTLSALGERAVQALGDSW